MAFESRLLTIYRYFSGCKADQGAIIVSGLNTPVSSVTITEGGDSISFKGGFVCGLRKSLCLNIRRPLDWEILRPLTGS